MQRYKNTSVQPLPLASGRVLAPGEQLQIAKLDRLDEPHLAAGRLVLLPATKEKKA